jgi:hypothetical protein
MLDRGLLLDHSEDTSVWSTAHLTFRKPSVPWSSEPGFTSRTMLSGLLSVSPMSLASSLSSKSKSSSIRCRSLVA